MTNPERRATKTILEYWPLLVVAAGGIVTAITFYNNVSELVAEQKAFKSTVDARREQTHRDLEDIRTRLTVLETWKHDLEGK